MSEERPRHVSPLHHQGPAHSSPYPVSRLGAPIDLVETAKEIQRADAVLATTTGDKLRQIAEQMRALQEQARQVLARAQRDAQLHRADCRFRKLVGKSYHVYERENGTRYFSMLTPQDWGGAPPHRFVGSYRYEADQSFTPTDEVAAREEALLGARALLGAGETG